MHPNHQLALDNARGAFVYARREMNKEIKELNIIRKYIVVKYLEDNHAAMCILNLQIRRTRLVIGEYLAAGENLVVVERLLEKA